MADPKHIVIAVHGIRDFGQWQDRLSRLLTTADATILCVPYRYGYFSVLAFLIPFARWLAVLAFRRRFARLAADNPNARFSIVAHSFGTHIVAHAIKGMDPKSIPQIDSIILAGSVLRSAFDWPDVIDRSRTAGKGIAQIINDCGWDDSVLILSQFCVLFTGMAGRIGFEGFVGGSIQNRLFPGGHGHYFRPPGPDPEAFMRDWWVPVLATGATPRSGLELPPNSVPRGIFYAALRFADPIKLVLYGLVFLLIWNVAYLEPRRAAANELYRRQYQQAAAQLQSDQLLPDAFRTLLRLATSASSTAIDPQHIAARFAQQRLLPFDTIRAAADPGSIHLWGGHAYLIGDHPIRLPFERPVASVHLPEFGVQVAVAEDRTLWLIDDKTGDVRWTAFVDNYAQDLTRVEFHRLRNANTAIIDFEVTQPVEDESPNGYAVIDLAAGTGEVFDSKSAATDNCAGVERAIDRFADDDDTPEQEEQHRLALEAQQRLTAECFLPLTPNGPDTLRFPAVKDGYEWAQNPEAPAPADNWCFTTPLPFPHEKRTDLTSLTFHDVGEWTAENQFDHYFQDSECFLTFDGPGSTRFMAVQSTTGGAEGSWHVCELGPTDNIGRCVSRSYYLHASARLSLSPNRRYLLLEGDTSEFSTEAGTIVDRSGAWSLFDLATMTILEPSIGPQARTAAAALTDDAVLIAAPVLAPPGATELWAYRYGSDGITAVARQMIPPPDGFVLAPDQDAARLPVSLAARGDSFVLTTISQQVLSLTVTSPGPIPDWLATTLPWLLPPPVEPLVTQWRTAPAGLAPTAPIEVAYSSDQAVMALSAARKFRLVATSDGTFLTSVMDTAPIWNCSGALQDLVVTDSYALEAKTDNCTISRPAPPDAASLATGTADQGRYLGTGTSFDPALPGETRTLPPGRAVQDAP